jgi:hypothetical protein
VSLEQNFARMSRNASTSRMWSLRKSQSPPHRHSPAHLLSSTSPPYLNLSHGTSTPNRRSLSPRPSPACSSRLRTRLRAIVCVAMLGVLLPTSNDQLAELTVPSPTAYITAQILVLLPRTPRTIGRTKSESDLPTPGRIPSLERFVFTLTLRTRASILMLLGVLAYITRLKTKLPPRAASGSIIRHRVVFGCFILASKFLDGKSTLIAVPICTSAHHSLT